MRIRIGALESESGMKVSPETKIYKDQNHYGTTRTQLIPDPEHRVGIKNPPSKTHPKKPKKNHLKKPTKNGFFGFFFNF
jgi:hypothetical protein